MDIIQSNRDKPWDFIFISANPNLTFDFILENPQEDWSSIIMNGNLFEKQKEIFQQRVQYQEYIQEYIFEELVKKAFHPSRIKKCLDLGYDTDDL